MQEKKKLQINKYLFISIASICAGIFVWWLVTDGLGIFRSNALPSPVKVASTFVKKWVETKPDGATLLQHLGASLQVALGGYLIGAIIGIPLGIFMAWNDKVDMLVRPVFDLVRTIPGHCMDFGYGNAGRHRFSVQSAGYLYFRDGRYGYQQLFRY